MQRIIREVDPPAPSARVAQSPDSLAAVAANRRTEARRLVSMIRGELDWIVLRAMEKDPPRRYDSAGNLAADVERFLAGRAVEAAPPGIAYRVRKVVRRHRAGFTAAGLFVLSLVIGLGAAVWQAQIAARGRDAARSAQAGEKRQRLAAERVAEFMRAMVEAAGPEVAAGRDPTLLREVLDKAVGNLELGELQDAPEAEADLRVTMSNVYRAIGDTTDAERLLEPMESLLHTALVGDERRQERYMEGRSMLLSEQSRFDESAAEMNELVELRRRMFGPNDKRVAQTLSGIGANFASQGRFNEAISKFHEALAVAEASGDSATIAGVLSNLSDPLGHLGMLDECVEASQRALDLNRKTYTRDNPYLADSINNLAAALLRTPGQSDRALELMQESIDMKRRLYPAGHPHLAISINNLAYTLQQRGELAAAEERFAEALQMLRKFGAEQDAGAAMTLINLSSLALQRGDAARTETLAREALEICERIYPDGHPHTTFALTNIGASMRERGRREEGITFFMQAAEMQRRVLGPTHPWLAHSLTGVGNSLLELDRPGEAVPVLREVLSIRAMAKENDPASYASALAQLATALLRVGKLDAASEAETCARQSLEIRRQILPPDDWQLSSTQSVLGGALLERTVLDTDASDQDRLAELHEIKAMLATSFEQLEAARERIPAANRPRILADAAGRISRLYEVWHSFDSSAAKEPLAEEWREKSERIANQGR